MASIIGNFFIGLAVIGVGYSLVAKTEAWLNMFGPIAWFERKLATEGGSRTGYKLLGILVIFLGVLTSFGLFGGFFAWILSPLSKAIVGGSEYTGR